MGTVAGVLLHIVNRKAGKYETKPSGRQWMESEGLMRNCPERHTFDFAISGTFLKEAFNQQLVGKLAKTLKLVTLKIFGVKKLIEVIGLFCCCSLAWSMLAPTPCHSAAGERWPAVVEC